MTQAAAADDIRHDWTRAEVQALFDLPFMDLMFQAQQMHRRYHQPNTVQLSTLLSIKTGACPEDCAYCPQSVRYDTGLKKEALMEIDAVVEEEVAQEEAGLHLLFPSPGRAGSPEKSQEAGDREDQDHPVEKSGAPLGRGSGQESPGFRTMLRLPGELVWPAFAAFLDRQGVPLRTLYDATPFRERAKLLQEHSTFYLFGSEESYGYLPNDRRHTFKLFGSYALNDEWRFGANLIVQSGRPRNCFGVYTGTLDGVSQLLRPAAQHLVHAHRHGVHQVGAPGLHHVVDVADDVVLGPDFFHHGLQPPGDRIVGVGHEQDLAQAACSSADASSPLTSPTTSALFGDRSST